MSASVSAVQTALLAASTSRSTMRGTTAVLAGRKNRLTVVTMKTSG